MERASLWPRLAQNLRWSCFKCQDYIPSCEPPHPALVINSTFLNILKNLVCIESLSEGLSFVFPCLHSLMSSLSMDSHLSKLTHKIAWTGNVAQQQSAYRACVRPEDSFPELQKTTLPILIIAEALLTQLKTLYAFPSVSQIVLTTFDCLLSLSDALKPSCVLQKASLQISLLFKLHPKDLSQGFQSEEDLTCSFHAPQIKNSHSDCKIFTISLCSNVLNQHENCVLHLHFWRQQNSVLEPQQREFYQFCQTLSL